MTGRRLTRAVCLSLMLGLGACGVKGPLEPPPEAEPSEVRTPGARPTPPPDGERPDEPFILDRLLI